MFYFFLALLLFMLAVIVHIFYCRTTAKPGLHAKAFIITVIIFLAIYAAGVQSSIIAYYLDPHTWWGLPFKITACIIFILLAPVYLCFYVLTQLTSPSKKILLAISQRGTLSHADILVSIEEEDFIMTRLNDLCASGCVRQVNGRYALTKEGRKIASFLNMMQLILGRQVGG